MSLKKQPANISLILILFLLWILASQACLIPVETLPYTHAETSFSPHIEAEVVFRVEVPFRNEKQILYLDVLDEVTGLALNPTRYELNQDDETHYSLRLAVAKGSFLKYRYLRKGLLPLIEYNAQGQQVRYRSYYVDGPAEIRDIVAGWQDMAYQGPTGRLRGQIFDEQTNIPLPNMVVSAGGIQTISLEDGTFEIENLPVGTHLISVCSINGDYLPFQQGALIAGESLTQAVIRLKPLNLVNIQFNLQMPDNFETQMPVRMVGNIASLGNAFKDLRGGMTIVASKAPVMQKSNQGSKYTLFLRLPTGLDLRYKYTLGDGFWNAELDAFGKFRLRQLIVPDHDVVIDDIITSWQAPGTETITFTATTQEPVSSEDTISIQFNPFGWMEPIPMLRVDENHWTYTLYSPLNLIEQTSYGYCYNDQCEAESGVPLTTEEIRTFYPSSVPQTFEDSIGGDLTKTTK